MFAYGDCLQQAIAEGQLALAASRGLGDWPSALPAMSNLGLMHFWRGEYEAARDVLSEARIARERLEGRGSALTIDVHLGGVLRDLGDTDGALALLTPVLAIHAAGAPDDLDARCDRVIVENHLAQVWLARGEPARARACLATDDSGIGIRFRGRRLALKLRVERLHGGATARLLAQAQAMVPVIDSPFNRVMVEFEIAKLSPPASAAAEYARLYDDPVSRQRPGLQLHAALCAAAALRRDGRPRPASAWAAKARRLAGRCHGFDLTPGIRRHCRLNSANNVAVINAMVLTACHAQRLVGGIAPEIAMTSSLQTRRYTL